MGTAIASERLIDINEVGQILGLARSRIYELSRTHGLRPVKIGRSSRWLDREVHALLAALVASRGADAPSVSPAPLAA